MAGSDVAGEVFGKVGQDVGYVFVLEDLVKAGVFLGLCELVVKAFEKVLDVVGPSDYVVTNGPVNVGQCLGLVEQGRRFV